MKDTTGTSNYAQSLTNDSANFTQENPTNELRWAWKSKGVFERYLELQQKWEIVTIKGHVVVDCQTQWRDVPEVDETEFTPTK